MPARDQILHQANANFDFFLKNEHYFKCFSLFYYFASIDPVVSQFITGVIGHTVQRLNGSLKLLLSEQNLIVSDSDVLQKADGIQSEMTFLINKYYVIRHGMTESEFKLRSIQYIEISLGSWIYWLKKDNRKN
jgi:hypothetical protein